MLGGHFFLAIGAIGIFVPLLPTTPLWLLAVFFYSRSSEKFRDWIMNHPKYGVPVRAFYESGIVSRRAKILATTVIFASASIPTFLIQVPLWAVVVMWVCLGGVLLFLWSRPEQIRRRR
jgi:hypothetical protein